MTSESLQEARDGFAAAYGEDARLVVRAPGRVNLIGEHTDYSNLPVLPIAIDRALWLAAAPLPEPVVVVRSAAFEGEVRLDRAGAGAGEGWGRYVAGALREVRDCAPASGARVFIAGDLPAAGGLSSSSALTVGLIAALAQAWGAPLEREEVARRAMLGERQVGVETGGMDQAAIAFAQEGQALRIDFDPPLRAPVPLPAGLALVIANSGVEAPKGGSAREAYNERVIGTRLAAAMLADQLGLDPGSPPRLGDVAGLDVVEVLVDELPERISAKEVAHGSELSVAQLTRLTAATFDPTRKVRVRRYARHVISEAQRVDAAEAALRQGDLEAFGELLDASHDSLRNDFQCSTKELDRLCAAMRRAGALGARLTGAGFGGYALAAVPAGRVEAVVEAAVDATGGPAFEVRASDGYRVL